MARQQFGGIHPARSGDKTRALLAGGLVFFIAFSVLGYLVLSPSDKKPEEKPKAVVVENEAQVKMVEVLVPVQEVQPGTALESRLFRKESRPQVGVSNRVVRDYEEIRGHYARSLIVPGQPLHRDYITSVRPTNVITANIPEGFRAVTIRVDARTSVEGFVRPGAKVDVVWASRIRGKPAITTIVHNAKVLSAERQTQQANAGQPAGAPIPSTVSLLVSAEDAQKIQLASTTGSLSLSLRGDTDSGKIGPQKPITLDDLSGTTTNNSRPMENVEGTVTIGGEKWLLVNGKLVPASSSRGGSQ
ncbi:MAG: Flp pilus assembly protein CpaB [Bdellovibrionales bacterium]|nr:Flp pilus assembly protein CpaB [Bdellovibrionales bacterium]